MPIFHLFNLSPAQYCEQFKSLVIPRPKCCPFCQSIHSFHRHGVYWRYVLDGQQKQQYVPVPRFLCRVCRHTLSILPAFVIPFFQYSVPAILSALRTWFSKKADTQNIPAACLRFWRQRFYDNLSRIELFFRSRGVMDVIPKDQKEKAIKLLCMVNTFPKAETFSQTFHDHCKRHFMAHSL
ncbi:MAG: DUF6431 domain-containing protein, partial [Negativicutes bacterium]|nr:DUF6431 domain-containing protein [Negativicutes bacterium]